MRHVAPPLAGQTFVTRGVIRQSYERKGNHYLVMDAETLDAAGQPVCRVEHTTIFAVRTAQPTG
jgi:acyl dehydratase